MDTQENTSATPANPNQSYNDYHNNPSGRAWAGLVIVVVGGVLLAKRAGADLPSWLFTWPMIPIVFGIFAGAKHRFRHWGWLIPVAIGFIFLSEQFVDISIAQYFWPLFIIVIGLAMIFRPKRNREHAWRRWEERRHRRFGGDRFNNDRFTDVNTQNTEEDYIDAVTVFGGAKKVIISKDFKGGEATTFFGGVEINLMQADINGKAELELVQVFGGTKLVVPSNWKIQTEELVSVFGGLDDKRKNITTPDPDKILVLRGTCVFGGIDIKSY
ncbi:LiaF transmembrane domain-containing protein [Ohtaekwangia sp.]|uniref:LiaF transmembrane domain-containing protein n=1 Tax=Ohtaekwangia sp. TaxID=2066019 RepID=UPI002FDEB3B2